MNLLDGLKQYKTTGFYYSWALRLEKEAEHILKLIKQYNTDPPVSSLKEVRQFLNEIEKWKAGCLHAYSERSRTRFRLITNSVPIHPEQHSG